MKQWEKISHTGFFFAFLSGVLYLVGRFLPQEDPLTPTHPLLKIGQTLHILFSPLLVFSMGVVTFSHFLPQMKNGTDRKRSGILLFSLFFLMVFSGYLLQVLTSQTVLTFFRYLHWITGILWGGIYLYHGIFLRNSRTHPDRSNGKKVSP